MQLQDIADVHCPRAIHELFTVLDLLSEVFVRLHPLVELRGFALTLLVLGENHDRSPEDIVEGALIFVHEDDGTEVILTDGYVSEDDMEILIPFFLMYEFEEGNFQ